MRKFALYALLSLLLAGCLPDTSKPLPTALAMLDPVGGSFVRGRVTFADQDGVTRVFVDVTGLTGEHGFHVQTEGDCRNASSRASQGHFNPEQTPHGQHAGDLPNLRADVYGTMRETLFSKFAKLSGKDSIVGHTLVVTAHYDDYRTQPDGNAGQVIACGVIQPL
ncbi:MAG TPA: superoxide dismutase family protein [Rhodocyclaceae bacterium]|nr:superoxide dismutase family protein [Rhodocyclaceae bacterium]